MPQLVVESGEQLRVGDDLIQSCEVQPFHGEAGDQAGGAGVREHTLHLFVQYAGSRQPVRRCRRLSSSSSGAGVPQEEGNREASSRSVSANSRIGRRTTWPANCPPPIERKRNWGLTRTPQPRPARFPDRMFQLPTSHFMAKNGIRRFMSSSVTGRRNARIARFSVIWRAQARLLFLSFRLANEYQGPAGRSRNALRIERSGDLHTVAKMRHPVGRGLTAGQAVVALRFFEVFVRLHMGTVDECHDDVTHSGFDLHGNLRKTRHDLRTRVRCQTWRSSRA